MALAPRSSLRSLLLLMSHGKPQLSSFSSSSVAATGVPPVAPGADTRPAAPAVQPPVTTARPDHSCQKLPGGPRHGGPRPPRAVRDVTDKACLNAPQDPSAYPTPDHGSSSTPEPVPVKPPLGTFEDPGHGVLDPPLRTLSAAVTNGSCSTPEPVPVKPPMGISEDVKHQVRDPPRWPKAVIDQPAHCSPAAPGV